MRHVFKFLILGLLVCCAVLAKAQGDAVTKEDAHPKAINDYETGVQAAFKRDTKTATKYFEAAIKREPNFVDALIELAGIYYNQDQFAPAEIHLERVAALNGDAGEKALYGLAMAELKQDKFDEAQAHLDAYLQRPDIRDDRRKAAERYLREAQFKQTALLQPVPFDLVKLPPEINTARDAEYLPALTADGNTLVFTRNILGRGEDFFVSEKVDGQWQEAYPLTAVNTTENEGAQSISADGKLLVFTACNRKDGLGSCDLYYSVKKPEGWSEARNLGATVNTKGWEGQPSLAANGNLLFFASRRDDGAGKSDLYASGRTAAGGWTEPMNLGPTINTPEDELAPFFHADGNTLYFMSAGHPGMGGHDLFVTRLGDDNQWAIPENLGYPINTEQNESTLIVALDGKTAFFATDANALVDTKIGVGGGRSGTTDLYTFELPAAARAKDVTYVRATVLNAETREPLEASALFADAADEKPFLLRRTEAGTGQFMAVLPAGKAYSLVVEEPGYLFYSDRFELVKAANSELPFELEILLQPIKAPAASTTTAAVEAKPIILRNVLFASGSAELLPGSLAELERLRTTLEQNDNLRIRIQGHTDDVGDDEANLRLSDARAKAVRTYLVMGGIDAGRLTSVGFGESQPLLPNEDAASRALNRRTEFVVLP